jgi:UDP:flavonoid glycosyltransferase YjiC (YdhE family)
MVGVRLAICSLTRPLPSQLMARPGHFLVVVWDGGGNVVPAAGLTAALVQGGHDVRVIGPPELQRRFERAGARFRPFHRARPPHSRGTDVYEDNLLG